MKKIIIFLLLVVCGSVLKAQTNKTLLPLTGGVNGIYHVAGLQVDSIAYTVSSHGTPTKSLLTYMAAKRGSAMVVDTVNNIPYWYSPSDDTWFTITGGSGNSGIGQVVSIYPLISVNDSTIKADTGRAVSALITGGTLNTVIDSLGALIATAGSTTFERALQNQGSTPFTTDNTVDFGGHGFEWDNVNSFLSNSTIDPTIGNGFSFIAQNPQAAAILWDNDTIQSGISVGYSASPFIRLQSERSGASTNEQDIVMTPDEINFFNPTSSGVNTDLHVKMDNMDSSNADPNNVAWFDADNIMHRGHVASGGGSGISKLGSPTYGLTRPNDSTYIADTTVLASQIRLTNSLALKLNISDTAAMLHNYLLSNVAAATYLAKANNLSDVANANTSLNNLLPSQTSNSGKFLQTDGSNTSWATAGSTPAGNYGNIQLNRNSTFSTPASDSLSFNSGALTNKGNEVIKGTATVSTTATGTAGTDSVLVQNNGLIKKISPTYYTTNLGTVTSVATNTGSGITGGTITTSGTILADTSSVLSTKAHVTDVLQGYVPTTRTVNGKALSSNITLGLASSDFANQGTTTTVLHGNASGNPSFGAVSLTTDISGTLPAANTAALTGDVTKTAGANPTVLGTEFKQSYDENIYQALGSSVKTETFPINRIIATLGPASGQFRFMAVWLPKDATITGVRWFQMALGSYTASNENRVGLYTYSGGVLTLVASSANDGTLWQTFSSGTWGHKDFSSPYAATAGLYYVGFIYNSSAVTTAPTLGVTTAVSTSSVLIGDFTNSATLYGVSSQTTLPTSFTMAGSASAAQFYVSIY